MVQTLQATSSYGTTTTTSVVDEKPKDLPPKSQSNCHTVFVENEAFRIPKAYRIKKVIGQGSYGLVWYV